jgi:hypothetical protein
MLSHELIQKEVFTFDLPNNQFIFGLDKSLEKIFSVLEGMRSLKEKKGVLGNQKVSTSDKLNLDLTSYMIIPCLSNTSYDILIESISLNGLLVEGSINRIAYVDSGNTLLAFPKSFYPHFQKLLKIKDKCHFEEEDNSEFKSLLCQKSVIDTLFEMEIRVSTDRMNVAYTMDQDPYQTRESEGDDKTSHSNILKFGILDLIEDPDLREYQIQKDLLNKKDSLSISSIYKT